MSSKPPATNPSPTMTAPANVAMAQTKCRGRYLEVNDNTMRLGSPRLFSTVAGDVRIQPKRAVPLLTPTLASQRSTRRNQVLRPRRCRGEVHMKKIPCNHKQHGVITDLGGWVRGPGTGEIRMPPTQPDRCGGCLEPVVAVSPAPNKFTPNL